MAVHVLAEYEPIWHGRPVDARLNFTGQIQCVAAHDRASGPSGLCRKPTVTSWAPGRGQHSVQQSREPLVDLVAAQAHGTAVAEIALADQAGLP